MLTPDNATFIKSLASASPDIILVADIKPSERPPVATPRAALRYGLIPAKTLSEGV